jgi:hypothetical protein
VVLISLENKTTDLIQKITMKNITKHYFFLILLLSLFCQVSLAQFQIAPLKNTEKSKTSSAKIMALSLPFFDDFSTSTNTQDLSKWQKGGGVFINNTFTTNHPTVNVATFDGLKANGNPYDFNNQLAVGATDSLTSQPIDLSKNILKDSLYLSFFYAKQGLGERPDAKDSLRLQFLTNGGKWVTVWSDSGKVISDKFIQKLIPINKSIYLHNGFQFSFQTYGRQSGQFDVWNLDYIYLGAKRNYKDLYTSDFAFTKFTNGILKRFNAMPMFQLKTKPEAELTDSLRAEFYDLTRSFGNINIGYIASNLTNGKSSKDTLFSNNIQSFSSKKIALKNSFKELLDGNKAKLKIKFGLKTEDRKSPEIPNLLAANDTISLVAEIDNYYAYDDGTAEQAAYLKKGFGRVAIQYILNKSDGVTAIRIHVPPTVTNLTGKRLTLQVLSSKNNKPDRILKTISDSTTTIKYSNTPNAFIEYKIIDSVAVVDTFYVGYVQFTDDEPLVVGLDINSPHFTDKHFYNLGNEWINVGTDIQKTSTFNPIKGSLMIRPVMAGRTVTGKPLATEEEIQDMNLVISPNPSTGIFRWNDTSLKNAEVFDMAGRIIFQEKTNNQEINLQNLNTGVYFLRLSNEKNTFVRKIVKE